MITSRSATVRHDISSIWWQLFQVSRKAPARPAHRAYVVLPPLYPDGAFVLTMPPPDPFATFF